MSRIVKTKIEVCELHHVAPAKCIACLWGLDENYEPTGEDSILIKNFLED